MFLEPTWTFGVHGETKTLWIEIVGTRQTTLFTDCGTTAEQSRGRCCKWAHPVCIQAMCLIQVFMLSDSINTEFMKNWGLWECLHNNKYLMENLTYNQFWCSWTSELWVLCSTSVLVFTGCLLLPQAPLWELENPEAKWASSCLHEAYILMEKDDQHNRS